MAHITKSNSITLTLTQAEAYALWQVLRNIGGNPSGPRGDLDKIALELDDNQGFFEDLDGIRCYNPDDVHGHCAIYIDRVEDVPAE